MPDTIQASFGLDLGPLKRGFAEAQGIARNGASGVANAMKQSMAQASNASRSVPINWANVAAGRGNVPGRGFRTAADFPPARPGQYPKPEEEETGRGRGAFGLAGLGGRVTLFVGIERTAHAFEKLNDDAAQFQRKLNEITKLTGSGEFRGTGDIEGNIKASGEALAELRRRDAIESQGGAYGLGWMMKKSRQIATGDTDAREQATKNKLRAQAVKDIDTLASKQVRLNKAQNEELNGSEREAALLTERIKHREKLGTLADLEKEGINNKGARDAEVQRNRLEESAINRRFDLRKREAALQLSVTRLRQGHLISPEQAALREAELRHADAFKTLGMRGTSEERADRLNKFAEATSNLRDAQFDAADQSPEAVSARNAANLQTLRHRAFNSNMLQMEDPNRAAYGGIVSGIGKVGPQTPGGQATVGATSPIGGPLTKADLDQVMQKYWGGN